MIRLLFIISLIFLQILVFGQSEQVKLDWINRLAKNDLNQSDELSNINKEMDFYIADVHLDILDQMSKMVKERNDDFLTDRFTLLKGIVLMNHNFLKSHQQILQQKSLLDEYKAIYERADKANNLILMSDAYFLIGSVMLLIHDDDQSDYYLLKSLKLLETAGASHKKINMMVRYHVAAEQFYRTREYQNCIEYSKKALPDSYENLDEEWQVMTLNNIGISFSKLGQLDSAIYYLDLSHQAAKKYKSRWRGIPLGNKAQVYFKQNRLEEAKVLFQNDYIESVKHSDLSNAANNLQWLAKIDIQSGNPDSAIIKCNEALQILSTYKSPNYLKNTYETISQAYLLKGDTEKGRIYSQKFKVISDSIEQRFNINKSNYIKLLLEVEDKQNDILKLQKDKTRNQIIFVIVIISFLFVFYLLVKKYYNASSKLGVSNKQKDHTNLHDEIKIEVAKDHEKESKIENEIGQHDNIHNLPEDYHKNVALLRKMNIYSNDDWIVFRDLFDSTYPGFIEKLRSLSWDITQGEIRMACLIKLQINMREASALLGISADSARKTRLRLKQRLRSEKDVAIEQFLGQL